MKKRSLMERRREKKQLKSSVVGVTWYSEENWSLVKTNATDPERFEATYGEWLEMAAAAVADLAKVGVDTVKFNVLSNELLAWCLLHQKPNSAASRAEFVAEKLRTGTEPAGNETRDT